MIGDAATDFVKSQDIILQRVYDNNTGSILVHDSAMSEYFNVLLAIKVSLHRDMLEQVILV